MNIIIVLEMCAVIICWMFLAYAIWKWGPGLRKRSVRCPERKVRAKVLADQREAEFGSLRVADVKECSLLPPGQINCSKQCRVCL